MQDLNVIIKKEKNDVIEYLINYPENVKTISKLLNISFDDLFKMMINEIENLVNNKHLIELHKYCSTTIDFYSNTENVIVMYLPDNIIKDTIDHKYKLLDDEIQRLIAHITSIETYEHLINKYEIH